MELVERVFQQGNSIFLINYRLLRIFFGEIKSIQILLTFQCERKSCKENKNCLISISKNFSSFSSFFLYFFIQKRFPSLPSRYKNQKELNEIAEEIYFGLCLKYFWIIFAVKACFIQFCVENIKALTATQEKCVQFVLKFWTWYSRDVDQRFLNFSAVCSKFLKKVSSTRWVSKVILIPKFLRVSYPSKFLHLQLSPLQIWPGLMSSPFFLLLALPPPHVSSPSYVKELFFCTIPIHYLETFFRILNLNLVETQHQYSSSTWRS